MKGLTSLATIALSLLLGAASAAADPPVGARGATPRVKMVNTAWRLSSSR